MRARICACRFATGIFWAIVAGTGGPVAAAGSTLTLTSSVTAAIVPANVTLTATVGGGALTGNIVFKDGASTLGAVAINKSKAVLTTTLGVGIHRVIAVYGSAGSEIDSQEVDVVVDNALACK